jgi:Tol biopolymer transport system component
LVPDGKQIAFPRVPWLASNDEKISIQIFDLASHRLFTVPDSENFFWPRWSPDGKNLAAISVDKKRLMRFNFATQQWTQWIDESGAVGYPTWSQSGKYLYFDNTSTNAPAYRRVKMGQTHSELLVNVKSLNRGIPSPLGPWANIAPDGSPLLERNTSIAQIYALDVRLP